MSNKGDCISRRVAVDVVDFECGEWRGLAKTIIKKLEALPAVQPDHNADSDKKVSISCGRENDLISRQEALKELAAYIHLIDKTMGKGTLTDDDCMEAAKSVLGEDELPAVQPETHWIPCSERLPEESGKYLVTVLDGIGKRTTSAPYHLRSKSWTLTGRMTYWKVIAWMPLPEPYRGGEK